MTLHAIEMLNSLMTNWTLERVLLSVIGFTMLFVCRKGIKTSSTFTINDI